MPVGRVPSAGGLVLLENLSYSLNAVVPVFLIVILGYILKRTKFLSDSFVSVSDKLVFYITLPVTFFTGISAARIDADFDLSVVVFCSAALLILFVLLMIGGAVFIKDKAKAGAFIQGIFRSNFAILGMPLARNMFGDEGVLVCAIVMPFAIVIFNAFSIVLLSVFAPTDKKKPPKETAVMILKNIATHPHIIGILLSLPFMIFRIDIPAIPSKALSYVAELTTPLALICLGANTRMESLKGRVKLTVIATLLKVVVVPAIAVTAAALMGFRGVFLGVILILFGAPTAVASYVMANNMNSDYELSGHILLLTTMTCAFTVSVGIFILKSLALI